MAPASVSPPSATTIWPVSHEASSESRNATTAADVLRHAEPLERVRRGDLLLATLVERGRRTWS